MSEISPNAAAGRQGDGQQPGEPGQSSPALVSREAGARGQVQARRGLKRARSVLQSRSAPQRIGETATAAVADRTDFGDTLVRRESAVREGELVGADEDGDYCIVVAGSIRASVARQETSAATTMQDLVARQRARKERTKPTLLTGHFPSLVKPTQGKQKKRLRRRSSAIAEVRAKSRRKALASLIPTSMAQDTDDEIEDISEAEVEEAERPASKRSRLEIEDDYLDMLGADDALFEFIAADAAKSSSARGVIDLTEPVSLAEQSPVAKPKVPIDPALAPFLVGASTSRRRTASTTGTSAEAETTTTTTTTRKTKRAAAARKPTGPREDGLPHSINEWPGFAAVARVSTISSVTCVDPGTRNLAIMRMEFLPTIRITHVHVIDLDQLRRHNQALEPEVRLIGTNAKSGSKESTMQSRLYVLAKYVKEQAGNGGCFDSDMCLVEEQSFDRVMARVESTIVSVFNGVKPVIRLLEQDGGSVPAGRSITARTVKTCYRPLFPKLPSEPSIAGASSTTSGSSAGSRRGVLFGVGDAHRTGESSKQRLFNKRNAIKFGTLIVPQKAFERLVPAANLTAEDIDRLKKRKMDDLYDTLFMCSYFLSTWMFEYYKIRRRGSSRPLPAHESPGQRQNNRFEELIEICGALGSDRYDAQLLIDALTGEAVQLTGK